MLARTAQSLGHELGADGPEPGEQLGIRLAAKRVLLLDGAEQHVLGKVLQGYEPLARPMTALQYRLDGSLLDQRLQPQKEDVQPQLSQQAQQRAQRQRSR